MVTVFLFVIICTFVCGNHEAGVVVLVGDVYIGEMVGEVFDDVQVTVEAGRPQGGRVRLRLVVDVGTGADQGFHSVQVT